MRIESIRLKNFRAFRNAEFRDIPRFAVLVGANGTGKSAFFQLFDFLKEAFASNVHTALVRLGGARGFDEVRTRDARGPIEIEIKFRHLDNGPLITYYLAIGSEEGRSVVRREILKYRRGSSGRAWHWLDFEAGKGYAVTNELAGVADVNSLERKEQSLKSADILAVRGLSQFQEFPAVRTLGDLIEKWHVSDFHISRARPEQETGYAEHLSREGENLALVTEFLHDRHPAVFKKILTKLAERVPGLTRVQSKTTEEGRVLLKFQDGAFEDPFLARYVSDGTIKMFAYLILLFDPSPHPLLCVEEPENQLYPRLLLELAEEFRLYAQRGGQVLVSTHSPDFLNAVELDEVFWLVKEKGYTQVRRARDSETVRRLVSDGDQLGYLWKQGYFEGVDPK